MTIVQNHRDLGGHLDSSNRGTGTTLTNRINIATSELNTITIKFGGAAQRATIVRGTFHARGLYSADTTSVNQYSLNRLFTAVTRFILGTNRTPAIRNLRSVSLTLTAHQPPSGATNDPNHIIFNTIQGQKRCLLSWRFGTAVLLVRMVVGAMCSGEVPLFRCLLGGKG